MSEQRSKGLGGFLRRLFAGHSEETRQHMRETGTDYSIGGGFRKRAFEETKPSTRKKRRCPGGFAGMVLAALAAMALSSPSQAPGQVTPGPVWKLIGVHLPTNVAPGKKGELFLVAANMGGDAAEGTVTITDTLPTGVKPLTPLPLPRDNDPDSPAPKCEVVGQTVTCTDQGPIASGRQFEVRISYEVDLLTPEGQLSDEATISGGGAEEVKTETTFTVDGTPPPFGFLPSREGGPDAPLTEADGSPLSKAGAHPYQLTASLGFPTKKSEGKLISLIGSGTAHEVIVDLPRGLIVNPTATPVLCREAELVTLESCPPESQVGQISVITVETAPKAAVSPLFNMVPPPGEAASLGFDALGVGAYVHLTGSVRSDGDFGLSGTTQDVLAIPLHPVFGARAELWGDPSSPLHDHVRGECSFSETKGCTKPVPAQKTALVTLPGECPGKASETKFRADSWQEIGDFVEGTYASADLKGNPTKVKECGALEFEPSISAQPTTNQVDSPSGFNFTLKQPQNFDLGELSTAVLKDATVQLPEGLVVNPSAGEGQESCTPTQIGLKSAIGASPVRFNKVPDSCPDAAKIGTIEVKTPLLAEVDETEAVIERDPEGNPIPRPLHGDVFLAEPFSNPFNELLAIYFSIEDPKSGTVAKFATKVSADPKTGRLTNILTESPQLPLEEVSLKIFDGPRAALRTPAACAPYTTTTDLVPWSSPEGPDAAPADSFALSSSPRGACPASAESAPNTPGFVAGTLSRQAGAFSPFVLKVSREDATQPIGGFEATLPPGLSAKLAGIPICSEAQIAQVMARNKPEEGVIEQADPSCPAASEVGTVEVAAGAGPTPLNVSGRVYLTGPYKNAPLSVLIVTPAVAGPFDLGAVAVRTALYVDGKTAQVRAVSDPLPTILEGIPLDLRSAVVRMGRPQFTLNPTSCEPMSTNALATSVFGSGAALSSPFQVDGCEALPFKPKLALRLKGGTKRGAHPSLQGTLTMKPGEANIAKTSVALPRSEFLDQSHIRTVCTRVQFAADQCPKGAIYGHAKAITPLLDEVLEGPIYLRSSNNELPDAVGVLKGPPSRPIQIEVSARIDSFKQGIRANFEAVPDAPVSKVVVTMQGGAKGLLINSRNLCKTKKALRSATVRMVGQNGKTHNSRPVLKNDCRKRGKKGKGPRGR